jgi:hypothetical protein
MSSRKTPIHTISTTQPVNGIPGDEWFNPTTNALRKLLYISGTTANWYTVNTTTEIPVTSSATYIVVGGGQSGSASYLSGTLGNYYGVGGGGGEVLQGTISTITAGSAITITVGAGGAGPAANTPTNGRVGANSSVSGTRFTTVTARGGGTTNAGDYVAGTGGSSGNGNAGASAAGSSPGSGGGAGGAAVRSLSNSNGYIGDGGPGVSVTFGVVTRDYGGGGGAGNIPTGTNNPGRGGGAGGTYSGGAGGAGNAAGVVTVSEASGQNGVINTGGGGGGHGGYGSSGTGGVAGTVSGNGASGRVQLQVLISNGTSIYITPTATGTYTKYTYVSGSNTYAVYDFTASGSIAF